MDIKCTEEENLKPRVAIYDSGSLYNKVRLAHLAEKCLLATIFLRNANRQSLLRTVESLHATEYPEHVFQSLQVQKGMLQHMNAVVDAGLHLWYIGF